MIVKKSNLILSEVHKDNLWLLFQAWSGSNRISAHRTICHSQSSKHSADFDRCFLKPEYKSIARVFLKLDFDSKPYISLGTTIPCKTAMTPGCQRALSALSCNDSPSHQVAPPAALCRETVRLQLESKSTPCNKSSAHLWVPVIPLRGWKSRLEQERCWWRLRLGWQDWSSLRYGLERLEMQTPRHWRISVRICSYLLMASACLESSVREEYVLQLPWFSLASQYQR